MSRLTVSASSAGSMTVTGAVSAIRATAMESRPRSSPRICTEQESASIPIGVVVHPSEHLLEFGERGVDGELRFTVTGYRAE